MFIVCAEIDKFTIGGRSPAGLFTAHDLTNPVRRIVRAPSPQVPLRVTSGLDNQDIGIVSEDKL